ncbi:MAG TPA: RagB/SusD family nutrient uptake outer membrane protein, partial [Chitinophagaceae bacterium]|nr:RagB/SusD family nutrient uptake outer membrane protein [Chitinophagaceae bacterium]
MKKLFFIFLILSIYSCDVDKYLDKAESGGMTLDEVFNDYALAERYLSNLYSQLPIDYTNKYTNASDDSESPHGTSGENQINNGVFSPSSNAFNNWTNTYQAIRSINIFLKNADNIPVVNETQREGKPRMIGEAT